MLKDLLIILYSWLLLSSFQVIAIPVLRRVFGNNLFDHGWGMGRIVGWLMVGLPVWFIAHAGIPANTRQGIWITIAIYAILWLREKKPNLDWLSQMWQQKKNLIVSMELLFLFGIVFLSIIRGYNPDINGLEKFMDAGLMQSYMVSPTLPIQDMWLAGETFNYYTFGHFLGALSTQFLSLDLSVGYNINLGFLMGLVLLGSSSVVINLTGALDKKIRQQIVIFAGVLGAFIVTFGGNTQAAWYFVKNQTFAKYWYPDATRFIINTIHEFPAYSFIVSDLHAHVWTIPIVLLSILSIFVWSKKILENSKLSLFPYLNTIFIGILLGVMLSTSTWSAIVYSLFLTELSIIFLFFSKFDIKLFFRLVQSALIMVITMIIISSPWWLHFESISEGVRLVAERSPLWQLVVLWVGHASLSLLAIILSLKVLNNKKPAHDQHLFIFITALALTGLTTLLLPEVIYFKDIYTTQPRANTMFKLTFEGFVMMSIVAAWLAGYVKLNITKSIWMKLLTSLILLFILAVGIYPYFGYRDFYLGTKLYKGLDGLSWLKQQYPDDYQGILWLKDIPNRPVILEAVGDSYTTFARVSAFSGKPTVLGWRVHEWLWRGGYDIPGQRSAEVEKIFNFPQNEDSQRLIGQYHVQYIFVGSKEREAYQSMNEVGLKSLGKVVFQSGNTYIIAIANY